MHADRSDLSGKGIEDGAYIVVEPVIGQHRDHRARVQFQRLRLVHRSVAVLGEQGVATHGAVAQGDHGVAAIPGCA